MFWFSIKSIFLTQRKKRFDEQNGSIDHMITHEKWDF